MTTDRLNLLQFEHLSLSDAAIEQFERSLAALRAEGLQDRYEQALGLYLADIADAEDVQQLLAAKNLGLGLVHGLVLAKAVSPATAEKLRQLFSEAAERAIPKRD